MSRYILPTALLLMILPSLGIAAPRDKSEAAVPDAAAPRVEATAPEAVPAEPQEPPKIPVVEGAGGPHIGRHTPPHGGTLVPVGEALIHLEFVLEPESGLLTLYVLDAEAKESTWLRQDMVFVNLQTGGGEFPIVLFAADKEERDPNLPRGSERFAARHRKLEGVTRFQAEVEGVQVDRQAYRRIRFAYPAGTENGKT